MTNKHRLLLDAFYDSVSRFGNAPAVYDEESACTYAELDEASSHIGMELIKSDLGKGTRALIYLPRCKEVLTAALGVCKSGCVFVFSDIGYPTDRLEFMLGDSDAKIIITMSQLWRDKPFNNHGAIVLFVDEILSSNEYVEKKCFPAVTEEDEAFVVYTSGSTGHPKGVLHSHSSLFFDANFYPDYEPPANESLKYCHIAGFPFIAGFTDLFSPLLCGGSTIIYSDKTRLDPDILYRKMVEDNVTCLNTSIRYAIHFLENYDMSHIVVRMGGEKVPPFKALCPGVITEIYGCSEGGAIGSFHIVRGDAKIPLPFPNQGVEFMLLDKEGNPAEQEEIGEIAFSGPSVALSYLNQAKLTEEKIFSLNGKRWMKLGDMARLGEDGCYYYVERKDFMIKLRGFRIEPGEIERQIKAYANGVISDCVCVAKTVGDEKHLCCYYSVKTSKIIDEQKLRDFLREKLAEYMIPEYFIQLSALPKNTNGKIDRSQLPEMSKGADDEVMSSLGLMRFSVEVYEKYGIRLAYTKLAELRTKRRIIEYVKERMTSNNIEINTNVIVAGRKEAVLSFPQRGIYAECLLQPDSVRYNLPALIRFPLCVTTAAIVQAVHSVVEMHPAVNVVFCMGSDKHINQILREHFSDSNIAYRKMSETELKTYKINSVRPFGLTDEKPLYRMEIINTEEAKYLFVDFHHLIFDGMSLYSFIFDINRALNGQKLYPERFTAIDLAAEQEKFEKSAEYTANHEFWCSRLSLVDSSSEILPDLSSNSSACGVVKNVRANIDSDMVKNYAKAYGFSPGSVYLAALLYLVKVYTCDDNAGIVTISSGRRDTRIGNDIGMFVNTLPIVCQIPSGTVSDFAAMVEAISDEAIAHENYPFSEIAREFSYRPNIMFAYQEGVFDVHRMQNDISVEDIECGDAKFPLYFSITGQDGEVYMQLQYDSSKYSLKFAKNLTDTFMSILKQFCTIKELNQVQLCTQEQTEVLDRFNHSIPELPADETIVSLFTETVRKYPERKAVVYNGKSISYQELDEKTDAMAKRIGAFLGSGTNTGHEPVVSVVVGRNENIVIGSLAVLKSGCAYQPIDPEYPTERIKIMLEDAAPILIIVQREFYHQIKGYDIPVIIIEEKGTASLPQGDITAINQHSLFTLLYTSGSTGKPKGVMLEHGNLLAFCHWYQRYYQLDKTCCVGAYASYGFDANMMDMYPALTCGACVCIVPLDLRLDMAKLNTYLVQNGVTHCFMTTQVGMQYYLSQENNTLRYLSVGGEKLAAIRPCRSYTLVNAYGPTECTIFSTTKKVLKGESSIPIGKPLDSMSCFILTADGRRVPPGAAGELILAGKQVGRGYLNNEEKTHAAFFNIFGLRAYHTGDIVRYRRNGDIEFIGRKDSQVKIRGFRIEPKEVEIAIRDYPSVTDVTVQCFGSTETGHYLAAYVVASQKIDGEAVKRFIAASKPDYMVPSFVMQIDAIPLNANYKVDKRKLPKPKKEALNKYIAPSNKTEEIIVSCIGQTLGIDTPVGINDSFIQLGGDSISAIRLSAKLREAGFDISTNFILRLDNAAAISKVCTKSNESFSIEQGEVTGLVLETPMVRYFKQLHLKYPNHFNQCRMYKAAQRIDPAIMERTLKMLTTHHDALRARFIGGNLVIMGMEAGPNFKLCVSTRSDVIAVENELHASMDIENGPLIQACIFRQAECDYFFLSIHHLIVDGVSWRIIGDDINRIYEAYLKNKEVKLPSKTNSLIDYSFSMVVYKASHSLMAMRPYWDKVHAEIADTMLTKTRPIREKPNSLKHEYVVLKEEIYQQMQSFSSMRKIRIDDIFIAALGKALQNKMGLTKLSLLCESHGRKPYDAELCIERTVGWFTAIYPVFIDGLSSEFYELILKVNRIMKQVPKSGIGYDCLYSNVARILPLVTFNNLGNLDAGSKDKMFFESNDYPSGDFIHPENVFGTDINMNIFTLNGYCTVDFAFNEEVFDSNLFSNIVNTFGKYIKDAAANNSLELPSSMHADKAKKIKPELRNDKHYVEKVVADAFAYVIPKMERSRVVPESDFFKLGGDRYSAADLVELLSEEFNRSLNPIQLYERSTVAELASSLMKDRISSEDELVNVYSTGLQKVPLFFVHTANSGAEAYYRFARRIDDDIAFAAANQYNLLYPDDRCKNIQKLAQKYITALKDIQPEGPYNLGGWCLGGTIAWEMTHQLESMGEKVEKLILIDSQIVEDKSDREFMKEYAKIGCEKYILSSPLLAEHRRKYSLDILVRNYCEIMQAWLDYIPQPIDDVRVFFIKATVNPGSDMKRLNEITDKLIACAADGYEKLIPAEKLTIVEVPQDHDSLMNDFSLDRTVPALIQFMHYS